MKLQGVGVLAYWSARDSIILPFQGAETVCSCTKPALKPGSYCIRINEGVILNLPIKGDGLALGEKKAKTGQCCPRACALGASLWPQHRQPMQMRSCLLSRASWVRRGEGPNPLPTQGLVDPRADVMFRTCSSSQPWDQSCKSRSSPLNGGFFYTVLSSSTFQTDQSQHPTAQR